MTPTGIDDHANLEWALRHTLPGGTVRLVAGTYKVSTTVVVANFNGSLVGSGAANTTVTCTDEFNYEIWETPGGGKDLGAPPPPPFPRARVDGSSTFAAPGYFMMYKTPLAPGESPNDRANRIEVKNLRFRGACLGAQWTFGDEIISLNIINSMDWHDPESAPATTRQDVLLSGLEVDGYASPEFGASESGCACITVLGGLILTANYDLEGSVDGDAFGAANGGMLGITPAEGNVASTPALSGIAGSGRASSRIKTVRWCSTALRPTAVAGIASSSSTTAIAASRSATASCSAIRFCFPPSKPAARATYRAASAAWLAFRA